jgi:hypothetical protein
MTHRLKFARAGDAAVSEIRDEIWTEVSMNIYFQFSSTDLKQSHDIPERNT